MRLSRGDKLPLGGAAALLQVGLVQLALAAECGAEVGWIGSFSGLCEMAVRGRVLLAAILFCMWFLLSLLCFVPGLLCP